VIKHNNVAKAVLLFCHFLATAFYFKTSKSLKKITYFTVCRLNKCVHILNFTTDIFSVRKPFQGNGTGSAKMLKLVLA